MTRLTALEMIAQDSKLSTKAADKLKQKAADWHAAQEIDGKSYYMGEAAAYADAYRTMRAEMQRLRARFQNGTLVQNDFGVEP